MKFLCLHGHGTNCTVMKLQTSALRHELEDGHGYEFVEGTVDSPMSAGVEQLSSPDHKFYSLWNPYDVSSLPVALAQLDKYVETEGPFDAVLGFSAGAVLAGLYLSQKHRQGQDLPFKCGVFLSSASVLSELDHLGMGTTPSLDQLIPIPTAHIWGSADEVAPNGGVELSKLFSADQRRILVHGGGHEIPRKEYVTESVHLIRRVVSEVTH